MPSIRHGVFPLLLSLSLFPGCKTGVQPKPEQVQTLPAKPGELPVEAFASLPVWQQAALSPSGDSIAFLENAHDATLLITQDRASGNTHSILKTTNQDNHIKNFSWVNDERLLASIWYPVSRAGLKFSKTQLAAVNRDGSQFSNDLIGLEKLMREHKHLPQFQDNYALLPGDPRHFLLALDDLEPGLPNVYKMDIQSGQREIATGNPGTVRHWLYDQQGQARVGVGANGSRQVVVYRPGNEDSWKTLIEYEPGDKRYIVPLGFDRDPDVLFVLANHQGRKALFKLNLSAGPSSLKLVLADDRYDINASLIYSSESKELLGVTYTTDFTHRIYWNTAAEQLQNDIDKALPRRINTIVSSAGKLHIVVSSGSSHPPSYYLMDEQQRKLSKLTDDYPLLKVENLASPQKISFKSRDGLQLEGILTKPQPNTGYPGPTIIFPHGGPWTRDGNGFNPWTQFFADRGWNVLQINFRGSAGFGDQFERAGFKRWGLEMQDDISDGANWSIQQKIADPRRICIVGASYGGYAALMGVIKTPDLYRCAVSLAPVTDLTLYVNHLNDMRWQDSEIRSAFADLALGGWWSDRERLKQTSPLEQSARIHTPLLLAHGSEDEVVDVKHSRDLAEALQNRNTMDFQYLEFEHGDHQLSREEDRLRFFAAMDAFLRKYAE